MEHLSIIDGDVLLYMSMWETNTLQEAKDKFDSKLIYTLEGAFSEDYVMALGGPNNFRSEFYPDYKKGKTRAKASSNKPDYFDELKSYAADRDGTVLTDGYEADDQIRIWSEECRKADKPFVVVTVDKDMDCIAGNHFDPKKELHYRVSEDYADYHYWFQLLMGDSIDNIPGVKGVGKVKAAKLLADCYDHDSRRDRVCQVYHSVYGDEGYEAMLFNGRLLHIWRSYNDHFTVNREKYAKAITQV